MIKFLKFSVFFTFNFQNGFVECEQENCPAVDDCYMLEKKNGCCEKCKGKSQTLFEIKQFLLYFN